MDSLPYPCWKNGLKVCEGIGQLGMPSMKATAIFSSKAQKYARYRWKYAPDCISTIVNVAGISRASILADIGAGTGILTKEFVGIVKRVYAVEPNREMRAILARELERLRTAQVVDGRAEGTTLADGSVDLVTVAQAIHWFDPVTARPEFHRILKPGVGWPSAGMKGRI